MYYVDLIPIAILIPMKTPIAYYIEKHSSRGVYKKKLHESFTKKNLLSNFISRHTFQNDGESPI